MTLKTYDGNIPKSGKKLINISGRMIFVRPLKKLNFIYDVETKVLLAVCTDDKKQYAFEQIVKRMDEIKALPCTS